MSAPRAVWSQRLQRAVPSLYEAGDKTVEEIAEELHVTAKTVVRHLGEPYAARLTHDILTLWERGMVPLAIAARLNTSIRRVRETVRAAGYVIPSYLTTDWPE